jgi:hypothetical protein
MRESHIGSPTRRASRGWVTFHTLDIIPSVPSVPSSAATMEKGQKRRLLHPARSREAARRGVLRADAVLIDPTRPIAECREYSAIGASRQRAKT